MDSNAWKWDLSWPCWAAPHWRLIWNVSLRIASVAGEIEESTMHNNWRSL